MNMVGEDRVAGEVFEAKDLSGEVDRKGLRHGDLRKRIRLVELRRGGMGRQENLARRRPVHEQRGATAERDLRGPSGERF